MIHIQGVVPTVSDPFASWVPVDKFAVYGTMRHNSKSIILSDRCFGSQPKSRFRCRDDSLGIIKIDLGSLSRLYFHT